MPAKAPLRIISYIQILHHVTMEDAVIALISYRSMRDRRKRLNDQSQPSEGYSLAVASFQRIWKERHELRMELDAIKLVGSIQRLFDNEDVARTLNRTYRPVTRLTTLLHDKLQSHDSYQGVHDRINRYRAIRDKPVGSKTHSDLRTIMNAREALTTLLQLRHS